MKQISLLTLLLLTFMTSPALAESPGMGDGLAMETAPRYDFDRGQQYLWSALGGIGGVTLVGGGTFAGLALYCRNSSVDCSMIAPMGILLAGTAGLFGGSMYATHATGGERWGAGTVIGSGLGALAGVAVAGMVVQALPLRIAGEGTTEADFLIAASVFLGLTGLGGGLGSALGYQIAYPEAPVQNVSIAPLLMDGAGVSIQGNF